MPNFLISPKSIIFAEMLGIKRLDSFMLQRFVPLLVMTFFICLFIVLMQFLFRMINDLVGKGLEFSVLAELFFYAALTMVPMALPLAVLLASLMVFGNLGEKFELTAMKSAGISLFRIMRPLIVLIIFIAIGAFFFQNDVLPIAQSRMWTLTFSVRQKTPEVEIPERSFYADIPGINLYVEKKNPETGMLYDMILYDISRGSDNARVILADSGKFSFTEDKTRLFLHLHSGEMFENHNDNSMGVGTSGYMPFRREQFTDKQIYFAFDANFNRMDESGIRSQYVGQNISQLRESIDSIGKQVDSVGNIFAGELLAQPYVGYSDYSFRMDSGRRVIKPIERKPTDNAKTYVYDLDSVFNSPSPAYAKSYINQAISDTKRAIQEYEFRAKMLTDQAKLMRRHDIELQKKFTLSFAILVFFFIGAPLGAIIKKGGLGTPLVISVLLFIFYYIIDNMGYKMARDGKADVTFGIWLSTLVLMPLGVFLTRKAIDDSAVFNSDAYKAFFMRLVGKRPKRTLEVKEVIMVDIEPTRAAEMIRAFQASTAEAMAAVNRRMPLLRVFGCAELTALREPLGELIEYLCNSTNPHVIHQLNNYPFVPNHRDLAQMQQTTARLLEFYDTEKTDGQEN